MTTEIIIQHMNSTGFKIIILVALSWLSSEILKIIIKWFKGEGFKLKTFLKYGGMPSCHSAFAISIPTSIFLLDGMNAIFAVALGLYFIVARDAMGLRKRIDRNSYEIESLKKEKKNNKIKEDRIRHTLPEIIGGTASGIIFTTIFYIIFFV